MTAGERLREQGRALGMAHILLGQLQTKFVEVPEEARARVSGATPEDLERWSQRLLAAQTLADVFTGPDSRA